MSQNDYGSDICTVIMTSGVNAKDWHPSSLDKVNKVSTRSNEDIS